MQCLYRPAYPSPLLSYQGDCSAISKSSPVFLLHGRKSRARGVYLFFN